MEEEYSHGAYRHRTAAAGPAEAAWSLADVACEPDSLDGTRATSATDAAPIVSTGVTSHPAGTALRNQSRSAVGLRNMRVRSCLCKNSVSTGRGTRLKFRIERRLP